MNRVEKINKLENIKRKYILLRNVALYCKNLELNNEKAQEKQLTNVKTLVLTKPFYGRELRVG